jgi:lysozyme
MTNFHLSYKGQALLKKLEGFEPCVYKDVGCINTIGYGTLWKPGMPENVTEEEAVQLMLADVKPSEETINSLVQVPLTQNQFDALVLFVYNVGKTAFKNSTLLRKLNEGKFVEAANEFPRWSLVKGAHVKGLLNRRLQEQALFNEV